MRELVRSICERRDVLLVARGRRDDAELTVGSDDDRGARQRHAGNAGDEDLGLRLADAGDLALAAVVPGMPDVDIAIARGG